MQKLKWKQIPSGYILVYMPDHPRSYTCRSYNGWVYEHILVVEKKLGRALRKNEEVHHLDLRRSNNAPENLLACTALVHKQIHAWLDNGACIKGNRLLPKCRAQGSSTKLVSVRRCNVCDFPLARLQEKYCSPRCFNVETRTRIRPSPKKLKRLLKDNSWVAVGRMYDVSDNAVRKWARSYGLDPKMLR